MILVTGATGILGRVVVLELLKRGKKVRATRRSTSNLKEVRQSYRFYTDRPDFFFDQIEWITADFSDISSLENALIDIEEVYHCAATVDFNPRYSNKMYRTNIDGTRNLLYACEGKSVKKFCFVSSTSVLDGFNDNGEVDENSSYNPKLDHSAYAVSKHLSEMEVWRASAEGLQTVIVNPGIIIGSGNWNTSSGLIFKNFLRPFTFSGGAAYIDVRDVAKISVELMEQNIFNERFILISENKKYSEVAGKVRKKMGKTEPKIIPKFVLTFGRIFNILFGWLIPELRIINKVNADTISTLSNVSNKKIKEKLGFEFIPVSESIDFHFENYISDHKI